MKIPAQWRGFLLTTVMLVVTGAQAAYPTPGGADRTLEVHPCPLLDPREVVAGFRPKQAREDHTLVADVGKAAIYAMGGPHLHRELSVHIEAETRRRIEKLASESAPTPDLVPGSPEPGKPAERFLVDIAIHRTEGGKTQLVGNPRFETPAEEPARLGLDGRWVEGGAAWSSGLEVVPDKTDDGRIKVRMKGFHSNLGDAPGVEVAVDPDEELFIDPDAASRRELGALGKFLNKGRGQSVYSLSVRVRPM